MKKCKRCDKKGMFGCDGESFCLIHAELNSNQKNLDYNLRMIRENARLSLSRPFYIINSTA